MRGSNHSLTIRRQHNAPYRQRRPMPSNRYSLHQLKRNDSS